MGTVSGIMVEGVGIGAWGLFGAWHRVWVFRILVGKSLHLLLSSASTAASTGILQTPAKLVITTQVPTARTTSGGHKVRCERGCVDAW